MKKLALAFLSTFLILGLVVQPGCKTTVLQYTLTVTVNTGVSGVPSTGIYTYDENQSVSYNYTLLAGYGILVVTLDGIQVADSGLITMNTNHDLQAFVGFNINGHWDGKAVDDDGYGLHYSFELTFSGGYDSGTVSGTGPYWDNVSGTYTIADDRIEFTLNSLDYPGEGPYYFTGTIDDDNHMSGTWTFDIESGIWDLERS